MMINVNVLETRLNYYLDQLNYKTLWIKFPNKGLLRSPVFGDARSFQSCSIKIEFCERFTIIDQGT